MLATMPLSQALETLSSLLGPKGFSCDQSDLAPWLTDWRGRYTGRAAAMLSPSSTAEVQQIVQIAAADGISLVPQGGNTGMVAGATPDGSGQSLLLSLRRMTQMRSLVPNENLAVCEAGVILSALHDAAASIDRRFPLTLGARGSATIGGLVATNAGGTQVLRFGTMRALVAGLEAVLPDGSVFDSLGALKKDNRGYDLTQLLIGSEGTLGIVTAATLRLVPVQTARSVAWVAVDNATDALALLGRLRDRLGDGVEGFEFMQSQAVERAAAHVAGTVVPVAVQSPWHLLIEATGDSHEFQQTLEAVLGTTLISDAVIAASEAQADAMWRIRETIPEAERASGPARQHDISVPVAQTPVFLDRCPDLLGSNFPGVRTIAFGHLGDGNIHFHVKPPVGQDGQDWLACHGDAASDLVYRLATDLGGSISAEHGIGQVKLDLNERFTDPARIAAMAAIKRALDPQGIMNPGKLVRA